MNNIYTNSKLNKADIAVAINNLILSHQLGIYGIKRILLEYSYSDIEDDDTYGLVLTVLQLDRHYYGEIHRQVDKMIDEINYAKDFIKEAS